MKAFDIFKKTMIFVWTRYKSCSFSRSYFMDHYVDRYCVSF